MKRFLVVLVALCAAVAVAAPAFAVDFKYGGMYRTRWQHNENVVDGNDDGYGDGKDDKGNWFDQRLRMYFTFVGSENLQLVTKWEADTAWGHETEDKGRHGGGDIESDATNLEMKNVYLDFNVPNTPVRASLGVQGLVLMDGWMFNADFSGAVFRTDFDPIGVTVGYVAAINQDAVDESEDMDDFFLELKYDRGPFYGALTGFWQHARDNEGATNFRKESSLEGRNTWEKDDISYTEHLDGVFDTFSNDLEDNDLFNLGATVGYQADWMNAKVNFIKNFGSYDYNTLDDSGSGDYKGWMLEALSEFYWQDFTFTLGGFYTSGDDDDDDDADYFVYPAGREHYWSEILGMGTLDEGGFGFDADYATDQGAYYAADHPTNLWMLTAGTSWQALEGTKVTFNYYYVMTSEDVVADYSEDGDSDKDDTVGHEVDFYLDQDVVDGLQLRLVGAYLFADDAYKVNDEDDDAYEVGARLQWKF
ncbi:MAG: hypothetical protein SWC40_09000 [Thermodesulfobacteriota bacterium]|nr:hypothetical protein [Thermodesulfobacteriota bacterium]